MPISESEVRRLASLARLALSEAEVARLVGELEAIVAYVAQLAAVDTEGVEPIAQVTDLEHPGRPDAVVAGLARDTALALSRQHDGECYLVPKVVER
ncbi:MAG: Asp-tRNA(Asn)/Glu-tRNA(Gln) amidotransferase subunit GatC [Planctomycetota bacterium]|nr:Asp-tRNA(Asn)/Glu-tRNA(Gln) amidotransferase subunit GatC [Planctomycetota bacterium]MCX8039898.1 Asp-tRNA(Asn)/Glu-tRNA(Gln) amidotransferase subunit GatC [Planctomycetota bacterium]MDW8373480.1 Asp-tRNA(Asn)/Glu-tRNA(Gln) amidotransferase subunit GatC [Planctomycetota bacterium]